mmetsp:Transcript_15354/g.42468  ORF Transcript_15354/g.42468 Transcript_15354/m.42468 type:complete len:180 (-) Transcript_15354:146-685(-)
MKILRGFERNVALAFFASHIPITVLIDGQGAFGSFLYPQLLRDVVQFYADHSGDRLMGYRQSLQEDQQVNVAWFASFILCECALQLPYFFVALRVMTRTHTRADNTQQQQQHHYPEWFRKLTLVYCAHVCTTLIPIWATFATSPNMTMAQKAICISIYAPYFWIPLWLLSKALEVGDAK